MVMECLIGGLLWLVGWRVMTLLAGEEPSDTHDLSRCDCWHGHKSNG